MPYHEDDPVPAPISPADDLAGLLKQRLKEAASRIEEAERTIHEWKPVRQSCDAGLEALQANARELKAVSN